MPGISKSLQRHNIQLTTNRIHCTDSIKQGHWEVYSSLPVQQTSRILWIQRYIIAFTRTRHRIYPEPV